MEQILWIWDPMSITPCQSNHYSILTRCALCSACYIHTSCIDVAVLSASGQVSHQCHFEKIARRINTMIVQIQLMAQMGDALFGLSQGHLPRLCTHANVKFAIACGASLRIGSNKLTNCAGCSMCGLLKLHLGHNNIVFNDRTAICTNGIPTSAIYFDVGRTAIFTFQSRCHDCGIFGIQSGGSHGIVTTIWLTARNGGIRSTERCESRQFWICRRYFDQFVGRNSRLNQLKP